jgi:hypothetical protein
MNFIVGDKFRDIADWRFAPEAKNGEDYDNLQNTLDIDKLKDNDIIYTHTFYVKELFKVIEKVDKKLILITHNSDQNIDDSFMVPDNVVKWYAQNVNVRNPKIISIPIGLENDRWKPELHKKEKMIQKYSEKMRMKNLVYMNHNIDTNRSVRLPAYEAFKDKPWVTTIMRANGDVFDEYLDNMYNHKYMICPAGNGMDTHRTWECLYMGTIPIEIRNINNSFHEYMPILLVDSWEEITEKMLTDKWPDLFCIRDREKLNFEYWKNMILKCKN